MSQRSKVLTFLMAFAAVMAPQLNRLCAQFYTVNFIADQASLAYNDCGIANSTYNTCFGIPGAIPNLVQVTPTDMLFIDVEGGNCNPSCGGDSGGDNLNFYETNPINVSGQAAFTIVASFAFWDYANFNNTAASCGTVPGSLESNPGCGLDMLAFRYSIDGGAWMDFDPLVPNATALGGGGGLQLSTAGCLSGNSVRIQIQFGSQSVAEGILIEGIQLFAAGVPTVITASETSVCFGDMISFSEIGGAATSWQWLTPTGSQITMNQNFSAPMVNDSDGWWSVVTTDGFGCTGIDSIDITVVQVPVAISGIDISLCDPGGGFANFDLTTVDGAISGGLGSVLWYSDPGATNLIIDPLNFSANNNTSVWARVTNGSCESIQVEVTLFVTSAPTADAGGPYSACGSQPININGSVGGAASSGTWTTAGDGSFGNPSSLNTTYTPGPSDIANGSVQITLTSDDAGGSCIAAMSQATVNIGPSITANAGGPYSVCANESILLNGSVTGVGSSSMWTTFGDGSFDNPSILNATYTPGLGDIALGTVSLTLTGTDPSGTCPPATDMVNVTITPAPEVTISTAPASICGGTLFNIQAILSGSATTLTWSTSGDGVFSNPISIATSYTPGPFDIATGSITITVTTDDVNGTCSAATDQVIIPITAIPTVMIDSVSDICAGGTISLSATIGGTATSVTWTSLGDGSFTNPNLTVTNYQPGPGDISAGSVTVEVTTDNVNGNCIPGTASIIVLINQGPTISIDPVSDICSNQPIVLNATIGGLASSMTWTSAGDGNFVNATNVNTIYNPGPADILTGAVTIFATTDNTGGTCQAASENITVNIESESTLTIDPVADICAGNSIDLTATIGGAASGIFWTTAGDGVFDNPTSLTPNYIPGVNDIANGIVALTGTTISQNLICSEASQNLSFNIIVGPTVMVSGPSEICETDLINLQSVSTNNTSLTWTSSGDGIFSNPISNTTNYTPGATDLLIGNVTLYCTVDNSNLNCDPAIDSLVVDIQEAVSAGTPASSLLVCENAGITSTLSDLLSGETLGGNWTETSVILSTGGAFNSAAGTFTSSGQIPNLYTFEYLVTGAFPCLDAMETVSIEIVAAPTATLASSAVTCDLSSQGSIVNFDALVTAGDQNGTWADTDGTTVDLSNTASVDFDGITPGNYTFTYTTNSATGPCSESSYTTTITVENCTCPSVATLPIPDLCEDDADFDLGPYVITTESGSWSITSSPAGSNSATISGTTFNGTGSDSGIYSLTYTIDAAPLVGCPDSSVQTVLISEIAYAGEDQLSLDICSPNAPIVNLYNEITGEDTGGQWTETTVPSSSSGAFDPIAGTFDPNGEAPGQYSFVYTVNSVDPCPPDFSLVVVNIFQTPTAEVSSGTSVCNLTANGSIVNFENLVTAGDQSGSWNDDDGTGVDLSNLISVDFNGILPGNYSFTYTTNSATGNCSESTYQTMITVEDCACPSVATLNIPDYCANDANFNLGLYTVTTESGSWDISSTPTGSNPATISGSDFNGTGSDDGIYTLTFTLDAAPLVGCPDSSVQNVTINQVPFADVASGTTVCDVFANGSIVDFDALVFGGDQNGTWADTDGTLVDLSTTSSVDFNGVTPGSYTFTYTTNSAVGACSETSYQALVTVENCACPSVATLLLPDLCEIDAPLDLSAFVQTTELGSWSIVSTPAGVNPASIAGTTFIGTGTDIGIYTLMFTLNAAPLIGCPDSSIQTLEIHPFATSGVAEPTLEVCSSDATIIDLFSRLISEDSGGTWISGAGSPTPGSFDPIAGTFNITNETAGIYTFNYLIDNIEPCADNSTTVTIQVTNPPSATVGTSIQICNATNAGSVVNLNNAVLAGDMSGSWADTDGSGVNLSNLNNVDFDGLSAGSYIFTYTTNSATQPCQEQSYPFEIEVIDCACPSVNTGLLPDLCADNGVLNLSGFVLTTETGTWAITGTPFGSNPANVTGDFFNGTNADAGAYELTYTLDAAPIANCPDSSVQVLNLFAPTNSGTASFIIFSCNSEIVPVDLNQFLAGADATGSWIETSLVMSSGAAFNATNGTFDVSNQAGGTYNFTYEVGANGPCGGSSTEYSVVVEESLSATLESQNTICNLSADGSILNFDAIITSGSTSGTWEDPDGTLVDLSNPASVDFNGVPEGIYTFTYTFAAGQICSSQSSFTTVVVQNCACPNPVTNLVPDVCENVTNLDLTDFNIIGQTGVWSISNTNGLTNPSISGNVMNVVSGEPGNYLLTFTLDGGPYVGCPDSSVMNFNILPGAQSTFAPDFCSNESIVINGTTYDASLTSGTETIIGGASNGCDSTVFINLNIVNSVQLPEVDTTICFGEAIVLYGLTFDQSNPGGLITFDQSGCDSFLQVTVNFYPEVIENYSATLCSGESININGTIFDETTSSGQAVIPGGSIMGCDSTVIVNLSFDSSIATSLTAAETVCLGDSVLLNFNFSSTASFDISYSINGNNFSLSGIFDGHQENIFLPANANIMVTNVAAIGSTCAVNTPLAPLQIDVIDIVPMANVLTDYNGFNVSCNAESDAEVLIDIMSGTAPYQLTWDGSEPDLNNLGAGSYSATVVDGMGCRDSLEFNITEPTPTELDLEAEDVNCPENQDGAITINDIQGSGSAYFYSFDNNNFAPISSLPFVLQGLGAGTVNLFIEDENQCSASESLNIAVDNNLQTDISPDASLQLGDSLEILVEPNFTPSTISWFPANNLSCNDCLNPIATPSETTIYIVEMEDSSGCIIEATIELRVERSDVYVPNAFSPNSDGSNDLFYIQTSNGNLIIEQLIIADRWGEVVFQANDFAPNDPNFGWDGRLRNEYLNPGVFVYYLQIKYPDGSLIPMKGDLTLLR